MGAQQLGQWLFSDASRYCAYLLGKGLFVFDTRLRVSVDCGLAELGHYRVIGVVCTMAMAKARLALHHESIEHAMR
eukprot:scaffold18299_cov21-Prasinocladus_malaysianus.AAC.1